MGAGAVGAHAVEPTDEMRDVSNVARAAIGRVDGTYFAKTQGLAELVENPRSFEYCATAHALLEDLRRVAGCARDFQRPRTAAAPSDCGINTVRAFKTERQVTSLRGGNHVATTFFNWTPRGFFVAGEHHDDAGVFQRADISQCLQGVEQNDVATLHVRATIAVCPIAVSAEVLPLKHSVDM